MKKNITYYWSCKGEYSLTKDGNVVAGTVHINMMDRESDSITAGGYVTYHDNLEGASSERKWTAAGKKSGDKIDWEVKCKPFPSEPGDDEKEFPFTSNEEVNAAIKNLIAAKLSHLHGYLLLRPENTGDIHLQEKYSPSGSVRIAAVPPGYAPESIRKAWIGITIPLPSREELAANPSSRLRAGQENLGGVLVLRSDAIEALRGANENNAANYWSGNFLGAYLEFKRGVCEIIEAQ